MERFRFQRPDMQAKLKRLYEAMEILFVEDEDGSLSCDDAYSHVAEDLQCAVKTSRFPLWYMYGTTTEDGLIDQTYRDRVRNYLIKEQIPFEEFDHNGCHWFLLEEDKAVPVSIYEDVVREVEGHRAVMRPCGKEGDTPCG